MRLLWEESGFELVGAFCVAAFSLVFAWTVLEAMLGLNTIVAGLLSTVAAGGVLEMISRRHYAARLAPAPRRTGRLPLRLAAAETASAAPREERAVPAVPSPQVEAPSTAKPAGGEPPKPQRPAGEREAPAGQPGARTVAGRRGGGARHAA